MDEMKTMIEEPEGSPRFLFLVTTQRVLKCCSNQFTMVFGQKTMKHAGCLHGAGLFCQLLLPLYQIIEAGDIIAHLHLQLAITVEPFYKKTVLFLMNCDALHAYLI